jgi:hypothetical protein
MVYPSKKDRRLVLAIAAISLVPISLGGHFLLGGDVIPGLLFLGVGLLIPWTFLGSRSEITATELLLYHGPVRRRVALQDIVEVFPIREIETEPSSPLDHLRINYQQRMQLNFVLLAPQDQAGFLRELNERVPGLKVTEHQAARD